VTDRQLRESSDGTLNWSALTVGAVVAGILAMGAGRAASSLFARDAETALLAHIIVSLAIAGGVGLTLGSGSALGDLWRTIRSK
jgi:hypothetical protein